MDLQIAANDATDSGAQMYWRINTIQPAMTPGMGAGIVRGVIVFSVMIHGRGGGSVARKLVQSIGHGSRTAPETGYATAWTEEDYRDAVVAPAPRGAIPAAIEGFKRVIADIPITAMIAAGTLMLGNVGPAMVEPILDEIGCRGWNNRLTTPMRYVKEPGGDSGNAEWVRIVAADRGADLQWLVDTGGDHDADGVARARGRMLETTAS